MWLLIKYSLLVVLLG